MKNFTSFIVLMLIVLAISAQKNPTSPCPATVTDYDGNKYNVIQLGGRCWMKENLRTTHYADGKEATGYHANYNKENDATYGLLYSWKTAKGFERGKQGICPYGWYLPSDWEWQQMEIEAGLEEKEANNIGLRGNFAPNIRNNTGWRSKSADNLPSYLQNDIPVRECLSCNTTGFSALPAGDGDDYTFSRYANFWTGTEYDKNNALYRQLSYYGSSVYRRNAKKDRHFSVRCVSVLEEDDGKEGVAYNSTNENEKASSESGHLSSEDETREEEPVFQKANTSDTLAVYDNGFVLHKLWTSTANKNVVSVVMSEPGEGVYRGLLYLRNVKQPTDILNSRSIDCQHLAGGYEKFDEEYGDYIERISYCSTSDWGTIAKTWESPKWRKITDEEEKYDKRLYIVQQQQGIAYYYKTSFTFYKDGTGYQTFTVAPELIAQQIRTGYSNGLSGDDRRTGSSIRGGYKFTINGTAKTKFKWEINKDHYLLAITYDSEPSITTSAAMTDKFENVYPANREQHIAQSKKDMATNPEVKEWKQKVAQGLKILAQQGKFRLYEIELISNHTLRLLPMWVEDGEPVPGETWTDFFSKDAENFFIPNDEEFMKLLDPNTLVQYETAEQKSARLEEEKKRIAEEQRIAEEKRQEEIRIAEEKKKAQESLSAVTSTCTSVFEKLQKCISEKTGYYDFSITGDDIFNHFDFSTLLSAEETTPANKATVLQYKLYPCLPLSDYHLDSVEVNPARNVYALNTLNRKESPKNVFDTYLTLRLPFANNSTILIDSISYKTELWQDNSEKKYDMREQMMVKDQLLLGKYKKIAPFVVKAYLNYQKKNQISIKKHYQQSDPDIQLFTVYQDLYLAIANLREHSIEKQQFISAYAGKTHADVVKVMESFMKQKESELLPEKEIQDLIEVLGVISDTEVACLDFLMNRRIIEDNHQQISAKKKTCKYIVDAYEKHFKSLDQSWTPTEKNDKLARERELQRKVLALINSTNASELNAKTKQMKKESIEVMIERLK